MIYIVIFVKYLIYLEISDISNYRDSAYQYNPEIVLSGGGKTIQNNNLQFSKKISYLNIL